MSIDNFREHTRRVLENMLNETPLADRQQLIEAYTDILTQIYVSESHQLLSDVIEDARTRLDARLSPDPVRQTIAGVQTTIQNIWDSLWKG